MAELGDDAPAMHERVGAAAARAADVVLAGGEFSACARDGRARARASRRRALVTYATNDDAIAWLREHARADDLVLLKGSRMYRMEQIVAGLSA